MKTIIGFVLIAVLAISAFAFNVLSKNDVTTVDNLNVEKESNTTVDSDKKTNLSENTNEITDENEYFDVFFPDTLNDLYCAVSFIKEYSSIKQLYDDADLIVVADVVESGILFPHILTGPGNYTTTLDYTKSKILITEVLKGNANIGDTVSVIEVGKAINETQDDTIGGVPMLKTKMRVVLFLTEVCTDDT